MDTVQISREDLAILLYTAEYVIDEEFLGEESLSALKEILDKYSGK